MIRGRLLGTESYLAHVEGTRNEGTPVLQGHFLLDIEVSPEDRFHNELNCKYLACAKSISMSLHL